MNPLCAHAYWPRFHKGDIALTQKGQEFNEAPAQRDGSSVTDEGHLPKIAIPIPIGRI